MALKIRATNPDEVGSVSEKAFQFIDDQIDRILRLCTRHADANQMISAHVLKHAISQVAGSGEENANVESGAQLLLDMGLFVVATGSRAKEKSVSGYLKITEKGFDYSRGKKPPLQADIGPKSVPLVPPTNETERDARVEGTVGTAACALTAPLFAPKEVTVVTIFPPPLPAPRLSEESPLPTLPSRTDKRDAIITELARLTEANHELVRQGKDLLRQIAKLEEEAFKVRKAHALVDEAVVRNDRLKDELVQQLIDLRRSEMA